MAILKNCLENNMLSKKLFFLLLTLNIVGCSRGALQGSEKNLGSGFVLYYITDTGKRIEYEGTGKEHYTVVSNTVDGYYFNSDYIFAIRNPSDNTKPNAPDEERYNNPCEFIVIDKNTHEQHKLSGWSDFNQELEKKDINISDLVFTFEKEDKRSCRSK